MYIRRMVIENFGPFRGRHALELKPHAYAVTARHEKDEDRSNFLGKTSLLEAIRFGLHGEHRHRTEDGWITDGEKEGRVTLSLIEGDNLAERAKVIYRSRSRGKSTKLECGNDVGYDAAPHFIQDEAQKCIDEWLGLSRDDFSVCHIAQGQAAEFVKGDPAARTARLSSWLRLEPLERCEANARVLASQREKQVQSALLQITYLRASCTEMLKEVGGTEEGFHTLHASLVVRLEKAKDDVAQLTAARSQWIRAQALRTRAMEYSQVKDEIDRVQNLLLPMRELNVERLEQEAEESRTLVRSQMKECEAKERLAMGEFGGVCPVALIQCPAAEQIRGMTRESQVAAKHARMQLGILEEDDDRVRRALEAAKRFQELSARRSVLLQREVELSADAAEFESAGEEPMLTGEDPGELQAELVRVEERFRSWDAQDEAATKLEREVAQHEVEMEVAREAVFLFGKRGAQRVVAEAALADIEGGANDLLSDAGVTLHVGLSWEREGKGPASECAGCGWAYPSSAQVRFCGACQAPRGPKVVRALEVALSRRSGAAEDLVGVTLSLAAGAWLRRERGAAWGVAMLDEPWAQTDRANRRAMASRLRGMLTSAGYTQAFVISHSPDTQGSLPGRIEVVSDGTHARLEVT